MEYLWPTLLALFLIVSWGLTLVNLPGNWLILIACALYEAFRNDAAPGHFTAYTLAGLLVLALLGEAIELAAGAVAAKRAGGSRRGAVLAIAGSVIGGMIGLAVGAPIPIVGSLIGALIFASLGALIGAMAGEFWKGQPVDHSMNVGKKAFWGRLWGSLGKIAVGALMVVVAIAALIV